MIPLINVLKAMRSFDEMGKPVRFSLSYVKADKSRGKAGEIIDLVNCQVSGLKQKKETPGTRHKKKLEKILRKDPNHFENSTLNLKLPNGNIRKIHVRLIVRFNGEIVIY